MKSETERAPEHIQTLQRESDDVGSGRVAPARVVLITKNPDGTYSREERDPEEYRREAAARFAGIPDVVAIRKRLALSQVDFAAKLKISVSTLRKWESKATEPSGALE